jgi:hypothetical protein
MKRERRAHTQDSEEMNWNGDGERFSATKMRAQNNIDENMLAHP